MSDEFRGAASFGDAAVFEDDDEVGHPIHREAVGHEEDNPALRACSGGVSEASEIGALRVDPSGGSKPRGRSSRALAPAASRTRRTDERRHRAYGEVDGESAASGWRVSASQMLVTTNHSKKDLRSEPPHERDAQEDGDDPRQHSGHAPCWRQGADRPGQPGDDDESERRHEVGQLPPQLTAVTVETTAITGKALEIRNSALAPDPAMGPRRRLCPGSIPRRRARVSGHA